MNMSKMLTVFPCHGCKKLSVVDSLGRRVDLAQEEIFAETLALRRVSRHLGGLTPQQVGQQGILTTISSVDHLDQSSLNCKSGSEEI